MVILSNAHSDVPPGHWAYDAVEFCYQQGIVSGISDTEFGADHTIRRGDFMLMLYRAVGQPETKAARGVRRLRRFGWHLGGERHPLVQQRSHFRPCQIVLGPQLAAIQHPLFRQGTMVLSQTELTLRSGESVQLEALLSGRSLLPSSIPCSARVAAWGAAQLASWSLSWNWSNALSAPSGHSTPI